VTKQENYLKIAVDGFSRINVAPEMKEKTIANLGQWLTDQRFEEAVPQIEYLIESANFNALFDAFFQQIPFGTGGRRGPVGFGRNRINPFTIGTSIQGHCTFLKEYARESTDGLSVVVAYDVRVFRDLRGVYDPNRPNPLLGKTSRDFATIAAQVYAANGIQAWFPEPGIGRNLSTPELSFTIRRLGSHGGLNVSASHNHPDDNGAKLYNARGGQEIPPLDEEMAKMVEAVDFADAMPWDEAVEKGLIRWIPPEVYDAYIETNCRATLRPEARSAKVVLTPLHGTGWSSLGATLRKSGFDVELFKEQAQPDGTFPNVPFRSPNPEVRESLGKATEYAREAGADLVLATDPDADRLGMVVPDSDGGWTFLNGNQIGTILASYMLSDIKSSAGRKNPFAVTTVVTTSLFRRIAESYGAQTIVDLGIGFKYIADVLAKIEDSGEFGGIRGSIEDFVLGIEESHGYLVTSEVRDKDAAGAGLLLAELTSVLKDEGRSVLVYLDDVYRKFGYVGSRLVSTVMQGARGFVNMRQIQTSLRADPPSRVGDLKVLRFTDRWDEAGPLGKIVSPTDRAARDLLTFELEENTRITLRPSGTESKNKIYVEACAEPLGEGASVSALERQKSKVDALSQRVAQDFSLEMLSRIDVHLPRFALEVSDLVPLEWKQDFALSFVPELVERLTGSDPDPALDRWIDQRLSSYGADGRLLVRDAVAAYCRTESPAREISSRLEELFSVRLR